MCLREEINTLLQDEIAKKSIESMLLQVSKNGDPLLQEALGQEFAAVVDAGTLVDVVAILPAILKLVERRRKKLALNHKVAQYIPAFEQNGKENIQIMNLLTHTSGLPQLPLEDIIKAELEFPPGSKVAYNEMNFQLLPQIFEQVSGNSLESFLEDFIFNPLRMTHSEIRREENGEIRLLSTISDLSHFATMIQQDGTYDYLKIINKKAVLLSKQNFTSFLNENRGLGWQFYGEGVRCGPLYSKDSYGFMGPDGVSIWIDPPVKLNIVLLLDSGESTNEDDLQRIRVSLHSLIREHLK